jgi:hypothetical protein
VHPFETIPDVRDLRPEERDLIAWLLQHGEPEAAAYVSQLPDLTVVSHCSCGCPSIDLAVNGRTIPITQPTTFLADVAAVTPEGLVAGIILHAREGLLSELEVYPRGEPPEHFSLPKIETITLLPPL